jgi:predicted membrane channel-forming protein YqfA (hemolysin III family)
MDSKKLIIAFTWIFILTSVIMNSWQGNELTFAAYLVFFVMGLMASLAVETMIPGEKPAGSEVQREFRELRARIDKLDGESR